MRSYSFMLAAVLSVAVIAGIAAFAMPFHVDTAVLAPLLNGATGIDPYIAPVLAVAALRTKIGELETRAAAKIAEVTDDSPSEDVARIETEHKRILDELAEARRQLADAERSQADTPSPDPVAAERTRASEITSLAQRHGMPQTFAADHIGRGTSIEDVRQLILDDVARRAQSDPAISSRVSVLTDEGDTIRAAVETAILHRANPAAVQLDDAARQYRGMSLLEVGRVFTEETHGVRLRGLSKRELAGVLVGLERRGGMMSTSDFPEILANVVSKRLRTAYEVAPQNWKRISRQSNAPDFKERAVVQLANLPKFKQVREGAEFEYAALTDAAEKYALATYGRIVAITRQTLINDDLGAFDRLPMLLGRAAAELEASIFWAILINSPTMADGTALFHADHGNLAGSGGAINETTLSAARAAMRKQKGIAAKAADREPLNLMPRFLVVSPDKETEAQKILTAVMPNATSGVNVFQNSMDLIVEARLTGNAWYLSADPAQIDTIEYSYLEGEEGLYTETRMGWEVDGIEVKGRVDFAAKAIDWRGLYKNPGN